MAPFRLRIPPTIYQELLTHALAERPNECCGLLAGRVELSEGLVSAIYPLANQLRSPTAFLSDPSDMFQALRAMKNDATEILAVYHSHPISEPIPSRRDLEQNYSPRVVNLIIGLSAATPDVRGWWLDGDEFRPADWIVSAT